MSANNQVVIRRKQNGLYEVRHCWAESGTVEDNTIEVLATEVDGMEKAVDIANKFCEEEVVEYGLIILN